MEALTITNEDQISDDLLEYIKNEAQKLSSSTVFEIDNYMDSEILNPEVISYLNRTFYGQEYEFQHTDLSLSFKENRLLLKSNVAMGGWFKSIREKARKVLCTVCGPIINEDGVFDWKDVIKKVLVALIPALAGGIYVAIVTPILIALIAKLIKYGFDAVCSV